MNKLIDGLCQALLFAFFFVSGVSLSVYYSFCKAAIAKSGEEVFSDRLPVLTDDFM